MTYSIGERAERQFRDDPDDDRCDKCQDCMDFGARMLQAGLWQLEPEKV